MTRPLDCWCANMPALPAVPPPATSEKPSRAGKRGCLCPACYADELAAAEAGRVADPGAAPAHPTH